MDRDELPPPLEPIARAGYFLDRAIWCAAFPLGLAILLCAGWWWFRDLAFVFAGIALLVIGFIAFAAGISWVRLARKTARAAEIPPGDKLGRKMSLALFLLFGNFPAALVCVLFSAAFSNSVIEIRNHSGKTLSHVEIVDPLSAATTRLDDLQPDEVRRIPRFYAGDARPLLKALLNGQPIQAQLHSFDSGPGRFETCILPGGGCENDP